MCLFVIICAFIHFNGHEFGWTSEVDDGQGGLACSDSWGRKESDTTEWLNWTDSLQCVTCCARDQDSVVNKTETISTFKKLSMVNSRPVRRKDYNVPWECITRDWGGDLRLEGWVRITLFNKLLFKILYLFIFGCTGSSLRCADFPLWWLLLLWGTGSRHTGFRICSTRAR